MHKKNIAASTLFVNIIVCARRRPWLVMLGILLGIAPVALLRDGTPMSTPVVAIVMQSPVLSEADIEVYRQAFAAPSADLSDDALARAESPLLLGHVLAERYLAPHYHSDVTELSMWLENFADHPQAADIAALAKRKGAENLPMIASAPLKGKGFAEHLGARSMPDDWYGALNAWRSGKFSVAEQRFYRVGANSKISPWHQSAGLFWAARAASKRADHDRAEAYLERARRFDTTFYGLLAARALDQRITLGANAPEGTTALAKHPAIMRAQALMLLGKTSLAEAELRHAYHHLPATQKPALVSVAGDMGLANLQLRLKNMDGLDAQESTYAAYPMPASIVHASAQVNPALILAITLQESAFNQDARSPAGATGLMQIMPSTAEHVIDHPQFAALGGAPLRAHSMNLRDPKTNVRIGSSYVRMLMRKPYIGGSLIHMLAAYNAGPGTVSSWQNTAKNIRDPLLYIESIPYAETRNYVTQVLAHYFVYQHMMHQPTNALSALAEGKWPLYQS